MPSLAEALPQEIARVSELIGRYESLPNGVGKIGAALMRISVQAAIAAISEGDLVGMMRAHEDLKGFSG